MWKGGRHENFAGIYAVFVLKIINELVVSGNNLPYTSRIDFDHQGWKKMFYLNPIDYLNEK